MMPVDIEVAGRNAETFPVLHVWGWEIALYLFLGGLAAGLLVLAGWAHRRYEPARLGPALGWMGPLLAPVVLSIGMFALFLDLENKWNVWRFYTTFRVAAPMSWGAWILILVYPASLLFAWAAWSELGPAGARLVTGAPFPLRRTIAGLNVALGAALGVYTGILLGALGARPLWNSPLLGPLFLASGLSAGAALLVLLEKRTSGGGGWPRSTCGFWAPRGCCWGCSSLLSPPGGRRSGRPQSCFSAGPTRRCSGWRWPSPECCCRYGWSVWSGGGWWRTRRCRRC